MNTTTETEEQDRTTEAVALIDAWLSEHAWWADIRSIDFALDVRRVLSDSEEDSEDLPVSDEDLTSVGAAS
jgi:hypothetical protein